MKEPGLEREPGAVRSRRRGRVPGTYSYSRTAPSTAQTTLTTGPETAAAAGPPMDAELLRVLTAVPWRHVRITPSLVKAKASDASGARDTATIGTKDRCAGAAVEQTRVCPSLGCARRIVMSPSRSTRVIRWGPT